MMSTGTVRFFNADKTYALVALDQGRDAFVHFSWVLGDQTLEVGQRVEFGGSLDRSDRRGVRLV